MDQPRQKSRQNVHEKRFFFFFLDKKLLLQTQRCLKTFQSLQLCICCQVLNPAPSAAIPWVWSHASWQGETWSERKRLGRKFQGQMKFGDFRNEFRIGFFQTSLHKHLSFLDGFMRVGEKKDSSIFQFPSKFPVPPWTFRLDLSCHYQGSVFGVWTHFVLCFFLLLTTEPTLLESWVCLTILLIITNKSFATSFVDFFVANHGYCNLVSLAHGNSQGFWNPPVVVFSVRKTRGLKIVVADDFGIYASAPSWMLDDDEEDDVEKDAHRSSSNI